MVLARPDSPGPDVSVTIFCIGKATLNANDMNANASQPPIAVFRCRALQCAIRAARCRRVWRGSGSPRSAWIDGPCGSACAMGTFMGGPLCGDVFTLPSAPYTGKAGNYPPGGRVSGVSAAIGAGPRAAVHASTSGAQVEEHGEHPARVTAAVG